MAALNVIDQLIGKVDANASASSRSVLGLGNPLLDISSPVDAAFMKKYDIKPNSAILAEDKHLPMYGELEKMEAVEYIGGGSTLNSMRVCQWMLQSEGSVGFMGCIGKDDFGAKLSDCAKDAGVDCFFMEDEKTATGTCAVCVTDKERSLVANLAAANNFKLSHCETARAKSMVSEADIIYTAGFFITVSPDTMLMLGKACAEAKKPYCLNLSAEFICAVFKEKLLEVLPLVSILFSNEDEAKAFATANEIKFETMSELAKAISTFKTVTDSPRTVVITQGCDPVVVAKGKEVTEYAVNKIAKELIIDSNGAGDAFVGGFLSQKLQGKDEKTCVAAGNYAASYMIQRAGTKLQGKPDFKP